MKLFEKMSVELDSEEPILSGNDAYDYMEDLSVENGNNTGSWAIWDPKAIKDATFVAKNKHQARPEFMVVGMNQS